MAGQTGRHDRRPRRVILPRDVRRAIVEHARADLPDECCGLLVGRLSGSTTSVVAAVPMRNVAASPVRYRIDDRQHIDLRRFLRRFSPPLLVVGVYHSHPDGRPEPSATDVAEAYYPDWTYVIVGLKGSRARIRAFALEQARMVPVPMLSGSDASR
jgi:proteasome lid subunit RPN8/RPN11|nr:MAG: hypothetical protein DIU54_02180 [Acidobacteriota bacterium]